MPRSPTSSEDEMAQSVSDYSLGSESDSSKEETIYDTIRATAGKPGGARTEEGQGHTLVIRILIQDLQQTVSLSQACPPPHTPGLPSHPLPAWPVGPGSVRALLPEAKAGPGPLPSEKSCGQSAAPPAGRVVQVPFLDCHLLAAGPGTRVGLVRGQGCPLGPGAALALGSDSVSEPHTSRAWS